MQFALRASPVPIIMKILYRPVVLVIRPEIIDELASPRTIGIIKKPASVGVAP
jgi:hypothetical protein